MLELRSVCASWAFKLFCALLCCLLWLTCCTQQTKLRKIGFQSQLCVDKVSSQPSSMHAWMHIDLAIGTCRIIGSSCPKNFCWPKSQIYCRNSTCCFDCTCNIYTNSQYQYLFPHKNSTSLFCCQVKSFTWDITYSSQRTLHHITDSLTGNDWLTHDEPQTRNERLTRHT